MNREPRARDVRQPDLPAAGAQAWLAAPDPRWQHDEDSGRSCFAADGMRAGDARRRRLAGALAAAWIIVLGTIAMVSVVAPQPACAAQARLTAPELDLKAAYLLSFLRFVRQETPSPLRQADSISVAIVGDDGLGRALKLAVQGRRLDGRSIVVSSLREPERLGEYDMVFIGFARSTAVDQALAQTRGAPVLTVGESDDFVGHGGMIGLFLEDRKLRFAINVSAAGEAGLRISSSLLSLAAEVYGRQR